MCSIAEYFYECCCILTSPQGESKYKQRVSDLLSNCFNFLIVSAVKTLKILKKSLFSTRTHTSTLTSQNFVSSLLEVCAVNRLQKTDEIQIINIQFAKIPRNDTNDRIKPRLHNYSNKFVCNFNTDLTEYDKQDYTRLASAASASKIICCKQTSTCTLKTALPYLNPDFFSLVPC